MDKKIIKEIAKKLSINYLDASSKFRTPIEKKYHKDFFSKKFINEKNNIDGEHHSRNILVVGAGATYDSYKNIPLANQAINEFKIEKKFDELVMNNIDLKKKVANFVSKILNQSVKLNEIEDKLDFENWLRVLSQYYPESVIKNFIQKKYNYRYLPTIKYELIAHLFKHRFLDVIINFNFDELLEQTIEEELGEGSYHSIISDGHCLEIDELMVDKRLKVPIYIKPHGTASHKSTLRFTKESYIDLPLAIIELMEKILKGFVSDDKRDEKRIKKINLFVIGFGMKSIEFNKILRDILNSENSKIELTIYHINKNKERTIRYVQDTIPGKNDILNDEKFNQYIQLDDKTTLDDFFFELWKNITSNFNKPYIPRNISRHEIVWTLFYNEDFREELKSQKNSFGKNQLSYFNSDYFFDRLFIEIAILLVKNKGHIDLKKVMIERIGLYYELYRNHKNGKRKISLFDICCKEFGLIEEKSFARNILSIPLEFRKSKKVLIEFIYKAFSDCNKINYAILGRMNNSELRRKLVQKFGNLYDSFTSDIKPKFKDRSLYRFSSFQRENVLHTNLALTHNYYEIVNDFDRWDIMCVVSERGKLVTKMLDPNMNPNLLKRMIKNNKKIFLITADVTDEKLKGKLTDDLKKILIGGIRFEMPYYEHNNHMVAFLKKIDKTKPIDRKKAKTKCGNYYFVRANYFYKNGLANQINPIIFESGKNYEDDHRMLMEIFSSYYIKSCVYMEGKNNNETEKLTSYIKNINVLKDFDVSELGKINRK